jgi:hypothetical protein
MSVGDGVWVTVAVSVAAGVTLGVCVIVGVSVTVGVSAPLRAGCRRDVVSFAAPGCPDCCRPDPGSLLRDSGCTPSPRESGSIVSPTGDVPMHLILVRRNAQETTNAIEARRYREATSRAPRRRRLQGSGTGACFCPDAGRDHWWAVHGDLRASAGGEPTEGRRQARGDVGSGGCRWRGVHGGHPTTRWYHQPGTTHRCSGDASWRRRDRPRGPR